MAIYNCNTNSETLLMITKQKFLERFIEIE